MSPAEFIPNDGKGGVVFRSGVVVAETPSGKRLSLLMDLNGYGVVDGPDDLKGKGFTNNATLQIKDGWLKAISAKELKSKQETENNS